METSAQVTPNSPFEITSVLTEYQFKEFPFIEFGNTIKYCKNSIIRQANSIKNNYHVGEKLILLAERGLGKTSLLFFLKQHLDNANVKTFLLSNIVTSLEHFKEITNTQIPITQVVENEDVFVLMDFPDTLKYNDFVKFLDFLWNLMTHPTNYSKINFIFAMNHSHYDRSYKYSELFGKFMTMRLDKFDLDTTRELISERLKKVSLELPNVFTDEALAEIDMYCDGIPRNILTACKLLFDEYAISQKPVNGMTAHVLLKEKFNTKLIYDRVTDVGTREVLVTVVKILEKDFNGVCEKQEDFVDSVRDKVNLSRTTILSYIDTLVRLGCIKISRNILVEGNVKRLSIGKIGPQLEINRKEVVLNGRQIATSD